MRPKQSDNRVFVMGNYGVEAGLGIPSRLPHAVEFLVAKEACGQPAGFTDN
jgi:hypothetical protein